MNLETNFYYRKFLLFQKFQRWHQQTLLKQLPLYLTRQEKSLTFKKKSIEEITKFKELEKKEEPIPCSYTATLKKLSTAEIKQEEERLKQTRIR